MSIEKKNYKKNHRGHNEGSCYQRKDGKWMGQVQVGFDKNGKRKFITKTAKTRQEISDWLAETRNDILKSNFVDANDITLEQWLWNWMTTYKLKNVSSNTYSRYLILMNNHIIPNIRGLKLSNVKSMHIQKIYNKLSEEGMSYSSLKHAHSIFNQALDCAVRENLISKNFATYTVRKKPRQEKEVEVFTPEEQQKILDNLEITPIGVLIKTAIGTGCRLGELLGLSWDDIDFKNNIINIRNGLHKEKIFSDDGKKIIGYELQIGVLKTHTSKRTIPIADSTASFLMKYKLRQREFIKSDLYPNLVFLSEAGTLWDESNARKMYMKFLKQIGVPCRKFHALRHTYATRLLENGIHPKVAQELLGHSTCDITMAVYSHVLPEQMKKAVEKIKNIL